MTNDKSRSDQAYVSADQVWMEAADGSTVTLQSLIDLLGPLKRPPSRGRTARGRPLARRPCDTR